MKLSSSYTTPDVPPSTESYGYDGDGNLTRDGSWTNVWNGENRRVTIESRHTLPAAARRREQWTHLPDGRWIQRIVSTNNGSAYYPAYTNRYVWDGKVLLAVMDHTNGLVMSFMRGLDLSGSLQGAGGVGGVLAVNFKTNGTHYFCYDGQGNVTALVNAANGSESARYEYGPFAEPLRMTGPVAKLNPIRFSTQYADDVTGDVKYLFRDLGDGRWPNRDPLGEPGFRMLNLAKEKHRKSNSHKGCRRVCSNHSDHDDSQQRSIDALNLYAFVQNNPVSFLDAHGLYLIDPGDITLGRDLLDKLKELGKTGAGLALCRCAACLAAMNIQVYACSAYIDENDPGWVECVCDNLKSSWGTKLLCRACTFGASNLVDWAREYIGCDNLPEE